MSQRSIVLLVVGLALLVITSQSVFTVHQTERALVRQLGKIVGSNFEPGLHFKMPFFQNVLKFDGRIQSLDSEPQLFLTNEKKNVNVDSFIKWRISDVAQYFNRTSGLERNAASRLSEVVQKQLKDEFSKRSIAEVISGERTEIMRSALGELSQYAEGLGIEVVDVRIKRIDLPEDVSSSVFNRMNTERNEQAKAIRSEGEKEGRRIRAEAERTREVLIAEAVRDGQRTRGEGDAKAAEIYANAYTQDAEFYGLYRSLDAYRNSFSSSTDVLLMRPDSEFFRYFKDPSATSR